MLGQDVVRAAGAVGYTRAQLDVTDRDAVADAIGPGDVVINCAAWTDVDGAEEHEDEALRDQPRRRRATSPRPPAPCVYVSSDYVFDGTKGEPYLESDPVNPLSAYGRTKLAGERATAEANPRHLIARSSWLFGAGGKNFVETMLGLGSRGPGGATTRSAARPSPATWPRRWPSSRASEDFGVHHLAATGSCSWFEFAREIFARAGSDTRVEPCTTAEFPRPAPRPAYSVLGSERGDRLPTWQRGPRRVPRRCRV